MEQPPVRPCPLCRDTQKMKRPRVLYGHEVCRRCWAGFMNRRQVAWILDILIVNWGIGFFAGLFVALLAGPTQGDDPPRIIFLAIAAIFTFKDGILGQSPGKAICGVQVVHRDSGTPAGFGRSFLRNWILLVPFVPLIVAFTMGKGPRLGDEMGKTRVIWKRYRDHPVFTPPAATAKVFE